MSHRKIYIGIVGLIVGFIGLGAMWFPVYLDQFDIYGIQVSCGNGLSSHLHGEGGAALVSRCDTALLVRRLWAIPTVIVGWLLVTWFVMMWAHAQRDDSEPEHSVPHPEIA
ncbi:hypothetical protein A5634_07225 [Mycobacterium asiaticum]|uniref:Transmembrane protein n=1 Tax=Mycobacterium asiaticum TaxID=1790 RepID=A0A1A3NK92_MYCAS|nr:hypothetical protein [Mycobacterium asiaticum]OBK22563.1 hypothetical protein A5634_07225 [Mycobacterium asiaticum]